MTSDHFPLNCRHSIPPLRHEICYMLHTLWVTLWIGLVALV
jgi:hypothetical protein